MRTFVLILLGIVVSISQQWKSSIIFSPLSDGILCRWSPQRCALVLFRLRLLPIGASFHPTLIPANVSFEPCEKEKWIFLKKKKKVEMHSDTHDLLCSLKFIDIILRITFYYSIFSLEIWGFNYSLELFFVCFWIPMHRLQRPCLDWVYLFFPPFPREPDIEMMVCAYIFPSGQLTIRSLRPLCRRPF